MKKYFILTLMVLSFVSPAHALFGRNKNKEVSIADCAQSLTRSTKAPLSLTNRACQHGQTNADFQNCTVNLLRYQLNSDAGRVAEAGFFCAKGYSSRTFLLECTVQLQNFFGRDAQYIPYSVSLCSQAREEGFASCVGELFSKAGVKANVAANLCLNGKDKSLNNCMIAKFKELGSSERAYSFCSNPTNKANYSGNSAVKVYPLNEEPPIMKGDSSNKGSSSGSGTAVITDSSGGRQEIIQPSTSFSRADLENDLDGGVVVDLPMPK